MTLDLSAFDKAVAQLDEALAYCASDLARNDPRLALHLRAAAIQAFEFTYELAFNLLRRFLIATEPNPSRIGEMSFNEIIRLGSARGLLRADVAVWSGFRRDRGATSHAYNETKAIEVFEGIPEFLREVRYLRAQLANRQHPDA